MRRKTTTKQQEQSVFNWNQENTVGCACEVKTDIGTTIKTHTKSEAYLLGGHTAVILVENISGCYMLSRVTPIKI